MHTKSRFIDGTVRHTVVVLVFFWAGAPAFASPPNVVEPPFASTHTVSAHDASAQSVQRYPCTRRADSEQVALDIKHIDLGTFTRLIACFTGERFLFRDSLMSAVQIVAAEDMTVRDARDAHRTALDITGFVLVRRGAFTRIIPKGQARAWVPRENAEATSEWITDFIPVRASDTHAIQQVARLVLGTDTAVGVHQNVMSDGRASATLVVTHRRSMVKRLRRTLRQLKPSPSGWSVAIPLRPSVWSSGESRRLLERLSQNRGWGLTAFEVPDGRLGVAIPSEYVPEFSRALQKLRSQAR